MDARLIRADVAVVGAGVAGLAAARKLVGAGARRRRPRGARPCRRAALEHGARRRGQRARRRVGRAVPVADARASRRSSGSSSSPALPRGRRRLRRRVRAARAATRATTHGLSSAEERALAEADAKLDALAKELDPEEPWEHPRARELDTITFDEWLRAEVGDEVARENLRSYLADGFLTKPAYCVLAAPGPVGRSPAREGRTSSSRPSSASRTASSAARSSIPLRMAEELGERVVLGAPVRAIRWRDGGVEIDAGARPRRARRRRSSRSRRTSRRAIRLRARAARVADEAPAGELAGQRDEGPRRVPGAVLARRRTLRRGLRAAPARARDLRQHAAVGLGRRPLHVPPRRAGRVRRQAASATGAASSSSRACRSSSARRRCRRRTTSRWTGRARSGRGVRTHRRSASAVSRASAPTCAGPSARSTGRAPISRASGTCTWRARVRSGEAAATAVLAL